jgi:hypothetical protein
MVDSKTAWIESVAKTLRDRRGQSDPHLSVKCQSLGEIVKGDGGTKFHKELAGTWTITLSDGTTFPLSLTYGELNDTTGEKLAAAVQRAMVS